MNTFQIVTEDINLDSYPPAGFLTAAKGSLSFDAFQLILGSDSHALRGGTVKNQDLGISV